MGIGTLLWADLSSRFVWVLLGTTLAFGLIGFYDDYLKIVVGNSKGLAARYKYLGQSIAALAIAFSLHGMHQSAAETSLYVPFFKAVAVPMSTLAFVVFSYCVIVGSSNAVNLDRRSRWPGHHARRDGRGGVGRFRLCHRQREFRALSADSPSSAAWAKC